MFIRHSPDILKFVEEMWKIVGEHPTGDLVQTLT